MSFRGGHAVVDEVVASAGQRARGTDHRVDRAAVLDVAVEVARAGQEVVAAVLVQVQPSWSGLRGTQTPLRDCEVGFPAAT